MKDYLGLCRSFCWIHWNFDRDWGICFTATYWLQQNQLRYFLWYVTNTSRHFCMYIRVFSGAHFSRTSLRFDLAASTSCSKHQDLHQQCGYCVVSWDSSRRIDFLALNEDIKMEYSEVCGAFLIYFSLGTICVSYLSIRQRLNNRSRYINTTQNTQILEHNIKVSKTLFTVMCASIVCLAPSVSFYIVSCFHPTLFAGFLKYIFVMLNQSNSLVNPMIYSFRMPIFRKTLKQLKKRIKIPRPSSKYTVSGET